MSTNSKTYLPKASQGFLPLTKQYIYINGLIRMYQLSDKNKKSDVISEVKSILTVIFIALLIRTFIIELFLVPTGSMKLTIVEGDYVFSTKYSYGFSNHSIPFSPNLFTDRIFAKEPDRGDVVITKSNHDMSTRFIKRLIGLPGDKIHIINDLIYINNEPIVRQEIGNFADEDGKEYIKYKEILPNGTTYYAYKHKGDKKTGDDKSNFGPYYIPAGHYFLLGDNRDDSGDSRYQVGFVPFQYLIAKARFIIFSTKNYMWDNDAGFQPLAWLTGIRFNRIFHNLYEEPRNDK